MTQVTPSDIPDKNIKQKCPSRKLCDSKRLFTFILNKKGLEIVNVKKEIEYFHSEKMKEAL